MLFTIKIKIYIFCVQKYIVFLLTTKTFFMSFISIEMDNDFIDNADKKKFLDELITKQIKNVSLVDLK